MHHPHFSSTFVLLLPLLAACDEEGSDARVAALEADLAEVMAVNEEIRSRLSLAEAALADHAAELDALTGSVDLSELDARVASLEADRDDLSVRVEALEAAGYTTEAWVLEQGYASALGLANAEATLAAHAEDLSNHSATLTSHNTLINTHSTTLTAHQADIAANTSSISALSSTVSGLSSSVSGLSSDLSSLSSTVTSLSSSVSSLNTSFTTLSGALGDLETELTTLSGDVTDIEGDVSTLDADLDAIDASVSDLETSVECPSDMTDAGGYCIDTDENTSQSWQAHAIQCQSEGKRMCSLSEWIGACDDRSSLGLSNMIDGDFEYVDEYWVMNYTNGNYYSSYVSVGNDSCGRIYYSGWACANSSCYDTTDAGDSYVSRCCL